MCLLGFLCFNKKKKLQLWHTRNIFFFLHGKIHKVLPCFNGVVDGFSGFKGMCKELQKKRILPFLSFFFNYYLIRWTKKDCETRKMLYEIYSASYKNMQIISFHDYSSSFFSFSWNCVERLRGVFLCCLVPCCFVKCKLFKRFLKK